MKKTSKILAFALVAVMLLTSLMGISASAASNIREVNFGELTAGKTTDAELVAGTGIYAFAGMTIDSNGKTVDGVKYTQRLKLPGSMKIDSNYVKFDTEGPAKVIVVAISGNGSEVRPLKLTKLVDGKLNDVASYDIPGDAAGKYEFEIKEAGTYYLGSGKSGINLYYISIEDIEVCKHTGGTATCKDLKVCDLCGKPYGELSTEHKYDNGSCTVCGEPDPDACQHTNKNAATCLLPETCANCGETFGEALGHDMGEATCTSPATCKRDGCGHTDGKALGHTLTFVTTYPTADTKGKTTASCSVCNEDFDFGEVSAMGKGTYVLDAADLAGIAAGSYFDGQVNVFDNVFGCHLSAKYYTEVYDTEQKDKTWSDGYATTHRMNFGGESSFCNNGEGDDAVRNGGYKNFIEITVTSDTTITVYWISAGAGRSVGVYDTNGKLIDKDDTFSSQNQTYVSTFKVPAGTYLIGSDCTAKNEDGTAIKKGGNYFCKIEVKVHDHEFEDATCETPKTCTICGYEEGEPAGHSFDPATCTAPKTCSECGYEEGSALGHTWTDATCTAPKTCSVCNATEGEALSHTWVDATCTTPKTCSVCNATEGEALDHTWADATCTTPKTCSVCGATEGDGLGHNYDRGVCGECGGVDPEYTIWNRIVDMIMAFIQKILGFFKKA